jgi:hypothetical protein
MGKERADSSRLPDDDLGISAGLLEIFDEPLVVWTSGQAI